MRIAFYAPMNAPDDGPPSGDRRIAAQLIEGLEALGHEVTLASRLKSWSRDPGALADLKEAASGEVARLLAAQEGSFDAWFTYHAYYKAPDLIGPWIVRARGLPYFIAEGSLAPSKKEGPWAEHYALTREALSHARGIFCASTRDRPILEGENMGPLYDLPPFVEAKDWRSTAPREGGPVKLVTAAMMREGDKLASYRLIAESLPQIEEEWTYEIFGDGPARAEVESLFANFGDRVRFRGLGDAATMRAAYAESDLFLWPGIGEGFGMVYLEAQAAGLPVIACNGPGPAAALFDATARQTQADAGAYSWAIQDLARNKTRREEMAKAGPRHVTAHFGRDRFVRVLKDGLARGGVT